VQCIRSDHFSQFDIFAKLFCRYFFGTVFYGIMEERNQSSESSGAASGTKDVSGKRSRGGMVSVCKVQ
jgi:hypothetical protein